METDPPGQFQFQQWRTIIGLVVATVLIAGVNLYALALVLKLLLGWPIIRRMLAVGSRHRVTSIADYIGARYGGEVFGTRDGGETWSEMSIPVEVKDIYCVACG